MLIRCPSCKRVITNEDFDKVANIFNTKTTRKGILCPNPACKVEIWEKEE